MDSLALLCNLYGDGPATLRRLRDADCGTLEAVANAEPETLAGLLRTSARAAQRFQSEGRLLLSRIDPEAARALEPAAESPAQRDPLMRKVLDAWRERDASEPPETPPEPELAAPVTSAESESPADLLEAGTLDGLDVGLCARLARVGVRRVADLAGRDAFEISQEAGLPYTRVVRLQGLARRARTESGDVETAPHTLWPRSPAPTGATDSTTEAGARRPTPSAHFSPAEQPLAPAASPLASDLRRFATEARPPRPVSAEPPAPPAVEISTPDEVSDGAGPFA